MSGLLELLFGHLRCWVDGWRSVPGARAEHARPGAGLATGRVRRRAAPRDRTSPGADALLGAGPTGGGGTLAGAAAGLVPVTHGRVAGAGRVRLPAGLGGRPRPGMAGRRPAPSPVVPEPVVRQLAGRTSPTSLTKPLGGRCGCKKRRRYWSRSVSTARPRAATDSSSRPSLARDAHRAVTTATLNSAKGPPCRCRAARRDASSRPRDLRPRGTSPPSNPRKGAV